MRQIPEWIAAHDDQPVPARVELRIYLKHNGTCPKCGRTMKFGKWDCDQIVALSNGGEHRESNLQPLCHTPCHSDKTKADRKTKARADRIAKREAGIRKPRRTIGGKRFDGTPIFPRWIYTE